MYKVYLSKTLRRDTAAKISKILPKDRFTCCGDSVYRNLFPGHEGEEPGSCDVVIYGAGPDGELPLSMELSMLVNEYFCLGVLIVVIREKPTDNSVSILSVRQIKDRHYGRIFDMTEGATLNELPLFLEETIHTFKSHEDYLVLDESQMPKPPYDGKEKYLFVSYEKKEDQLQAYPLIRNLQDHGYRVWYDNTETKAYDPEKIAERIEECGCMIALISPRYIESQSCKDEINLARDLNKERILVYLSKTKMSTGMAMRLLRLQAIHKYTYKTRQEFYDKLYSAKGIDSAKEK